MNEPRTPEIPHWLSPVVAYIECLSEALDTTTQASDRAVYLAHLGEAARLVALLARGLPTADWLSAEERRHGTTFLSGTQGEATGEAFLALATALRK